ncbi:MAG: macro domain-containing protein [Chloroflexota bacterium]
MQLILVDIYDEVCKAFETYFADLPNVTVFHGKFQDVETYDCMVSPANSFGIMDGGIDAAITQFFGEQLMQRVQRRLRDEWGCEQPVGTSIIVKTMHPEHPYLAHTPTMRVPMTIVKTDIVYNAMWAMLHAVNNFNKTAEKPIETILCPGLGTATGGMPPEEAARQMALAYKNFLNPPSVIEWDAMLRRQREIRFGGYYGFTQEKMDGDKFDD